MLPASSMALSYAARDFSTAAQPAQQVGAGRMVGVIAGQFVLQTVDGRQCHLWAVELRLTAMARLRAMIGEVVEADELVVEGGDLRPVGVAYIAGGGVHGVVSRRGSGSDQESPRRRSRSPKPIGHRSDHPRPTPRGRNRRWPPRLSMTVGRAGRREATGEDPSDPPPGSRSLNTSEWQPSRPGWRGRPCRRSRKASDSCISDTSSCGSGRPPCGRSPWSTNTSAAPIRHRLPDVFQDFLVRRL